MNTSSSVLHTILAAPLVSVVVVVLVLIMVALALLAIVVTQLGTRLRNLTSPVYDRIVKEAESKAEQMLEQAREESRSIRASAEASSQKVYADTKAQDDAFNKKQLEELKGVAEEAKNLIQKEGADASERIRALADAAKAQEDGIQQQVADIRTKLTETLSHEDEALKDAFTKLRGGMEQEAKQLSETTRQQVEDMLAKELNSVREAVAAYREKRLAMVDQDIVALVEETARIALNASLSLDEHRDIIVGALNDAKKQGIFSA